MKHFVPEASSRPEFGRWLLSQMKREDAIGELAKAARRDPKFPINGAVKDVASRLNKLDADPDMHCALDDAELEWLAY
ncbi:hypothetical protein CG471_11775 [Sphingobium sp. IP1]|uniref:hypothetical protein n=1 Tax=Sphingobium sp. IP1 TaxID=2021637 RepID=UPI000C07CB13|nr:hypothetical protein [Sphingobium sp. IP1]PHP19531.1 hypothetical protein CG471_11775 [Sphingobium sp. IP1]